MRAAVKSTERHGGWRSGVLKLMPIDSSHRDAQGTIAVLHSCINSTTSITCLMLPSPQVDGADDADKPHQQGMRKGHQPALAVFPHDPMPAFISQIALHPQEISPWPWVLACAGAKPAASPTRT